jgi:hypothetical protein
MFKKIFVHCFALSQCLWLLNPQASYAADETSLFKGGHAKYFFLLNTYPEDSFFRDYIDSPAIDNNGDLRLKFAERKDKLSFAADYQMVAQHGDSVTLSNSLPGNVLIPDRVPSDDFRLFDLTHVIHDADNSILAHRLDRMYVDYSSANTVVRLGRQAISWGNGMIYTPMDFFNPFDPAAVDKEYKTGDDMAYGQYLLDNGDDLQAVWVIRRDVNGDVSSEVDSVAAKYHGFFADREIDFLLAQHFDDTIIGFGGISDLGEAIWRGDITVTRTSSKDVPSLVTSLTYSWVGWGHNISGIAEYFYNGFGQHKDQYDTASLAKNPDLTDRIIRGELFTIGRHYIALSAMVEMTPLWMLTPNMFINADDGSFFAQLVSSYDLKQDWQLLVAAGLPFGSAGTEYGGIDSGIPGKQLSSGFNVFAQLAWYF